MPPVPAGVRRYLLSSMKDIGVSWHESLSLPCPASFHAWGYNESPVFWRFGVPHEPEKSCTERLWHEYWDCPWQVWSSGCQGSWCLHGIWFPQPSRLRYGVTGYLHALRLLAAQQTQIYCTYRFWHIRNQSFEYLLGASAVIPGPRPAVFYFIKIPQDLATFQDCFAGGFIFDYFVKHSAFIIGQSDGIYFRSCHKGSSL